MPGAVRFAIIRRKAAGRGEEDADLGHHSAVLCGGRFCRRAAGRGRLAAVGGRACLLAGLVLLGLKRTMPARLRLRGMLILFALCGALVYTALFQALVQAPVTARCGQTGSSPARCSPARWRRWGVRVTIRLSGSAAKAEVYADAEYAGLEPGSSSPARPNGRTPPASGKTM